MPSVSANWTDYGRTRPAVQSLTTATGTPLLIVRSSSSNRPSADTSKGDRATGITGISTATRLRDAMDVDELKSPALYFGTTTGQVWIGREGGEKWECLFDSLPPIHSVKVAVV